ncbi:HNH endonuclease signature motif containing protein [Nocardioides jishulii]|nr:HNH endonuclease signature motif containing protein [Nocardioides jishulii]
MHPVNVVAASISSSLKSVADVNPTFMRTDEKADALLALADAESRVAELRLRVMAAAGDVAEGEGFRSIATWLAHHGHVRRGDAAADLRLATALDRQRLTLARAVREGQVSIAQARVIAAAVDELPSRVGADVIEAAEVRLVELAADHDPTDLARLGRRILEVVDPDRFEDEEARRLAEAEKHAQERQRLRIRALGDGTSRISAIVPDATAARLATYLHAFTNPRLADGAVRSNAAQDDTGNDRDADEQTGFGVQVSHPRRMAEAFAQLLEALDPKRLPIHGGDATNVTVTITLDALRDGIGTATLDNGVPGDGFDTLTAAQARRLACNAKIIPAVLGTDSEVLDLGRASRLFSKAQRRALALRDQTCRAEGCDIPGTWSEAHHLVPWSQGGATDLDNAALLCSHHHHRAHDPGYDTSRMANGDLRFHRRR